MPNTNTLRLGQDSEYKGDDWWSWSVWLDASEETLDSVDYVEYTLHRSFPKPVRKARDRASKFALKTGGWGTFTVYANVVFNDGQTVNLDHELELYYPDGDKATA